MYCDVEWRYGNDRLILDYKQYFSSSGWSYIYFNCKPDTPQCYFEFLDKTRLLPTDLLPSRLGINWNMPKEAVLKAIKGQVLELPSHYSPCYSEVLILVDDHPFKAQLWFSADKKHLLRIEVVIYSSRQFWVGDWDYDEMNAIGKQVKQRYDQYVNYCSSILGSPLYSGDGSLIVPANPDEIGYHGLLAIWASEEARMQVQFDKEDKELPFQISVACYPVLPGLAERIAKAEQQSYSNFEQEES